MTTWLRQGDAEWRKIRYHRWIVLTTVALGLFLPAMVLVLNEPVRELDAAGIADQLLQSVYLGQVGFVLIAALYFGREFGGRSLRTSLIAVPHRVRFLLVKALCLLLFQMLCAMIYTGLALAVVALHFDVALTPELVLSWIAGLAPAYLSAFQLSGIAAGLIVLTGSMTASLSVVVSLILGLGQLLLQFGACFRLFPVLAVMNVFWTETVPGYLPVGAGLLVQSGWLLGVWVAAVLRFRQAAVR
ncbi:MAG: hypothetical protein Q4A52_07735 [Bacillota bacterium]|nr:hypothetical protein [Bacillota bacterium]